MWGKAGKNKHISNKTRQSKRMVNAAQGKGKGNHKSQSKQKQSKARQMQAKAKPWGWGRAKAKLAGCFKKVEWGCPPSLATRGLVAA